jgi:chromosome segregation ATPase
VLFQASAVGADMPEVVEDTLNYKSPAHKLIRFFRDSRDKWKAKYKQCKADRKRMQNHVNDATRSRAQWRRKAEESERARASLQSEVDELRAQLAAAQVSKT